MTQNAAIMQNLMEVLTSAGINLRQNVSLQQQGIVEQLQNISMQSPPSPPNHAFCIQSDNDLSRSWLSGASFRPMQPTDLRSVHPDQIHFFPSAHIGLMNSAPGIPKTHPLGFAMPDVKMTADADRDLLYPSFDPRQRFLTDPALPEHSHTSTYVGGVAHLASGLPVFSDSEDGSSGDSPYSPSFYSTSDGSDASDSLEDVFESLDDLKTGDPTSFPTVDMLAKDQTMLDELSDLIMMMEDDPHTAEALTTTDPIPPAFLEGTNGFMNMLSMQLMPATHPQLPLQSQPQVSLPSVEQHPFYSTSDFVIPQSTASSNAFGAIPSSRLREALMSVPTSSPSVSSTSSQPGSPVLVPGCEGSDITSINNERGKSGVIKRRQKPMKDIGPIMPPQLGASGSASLWEFILELLADAPSYGQFIRWKDREHGTFKIYDSQVVAALWGKHKNRTNMNFDKMSRAMRYYYGKNILEKGPDGGRLEYEFRPGSQWLRYVSRNLNNHSFVAPNPNQFSDDDRKGQTGRVTRRRASARPLAKSSSPY